MVVGFFGFVFCPMDYKHWN